MVVKFLFPLLGFISGIIISDFCNVGLWISTLTLGVALIIYICIHLISKDPLKGYNISIYHNFWIFLLFFSLGGIDYNYNCKATVNIDLEDKKCNIKGEIKDIKYLVEGDRYNLKVISIQDTLGRNIKFSNLNILIQTDGYYAHIGEVISFPAKPQKFNSGYIDRMKHQGLSYFCRVKSDSISTINILSSPFLFFYNLKQDLIIKLEKSSLNRPTAEFLISLLLGDKSMLDPNVRQTLTSAGMAHILALSGLHVAIVLSIFLFLLFPLNFFGHRKIRMICAIILIWGYVVLTGNALSTCRAAIMASFIVLAFITERKNSSFNALLASVLFIIIINPLSLWNVGLQLSFLCVASIIIFVNRLNPVNRHTHPYLYSIINAVLITILCTFTSWVLVAYYFGNVPLMFLSTNLLLLPFLPIFIFFGFFYTMALTLGIDLYFLTKILDLYHDFFVGAVNFLSDSGSSTINLNIPPLTIIIWFLGVTLYASLLHCHRLRYKKFIGVIATFFFIASISYTIFFEPTKSQSIKFVNKIGTIESWYKINNDNIHLEFPVNNISNVTTDHFKILAIDQSVKSDLLANLKIKNSELSHYLLVGSHADINQIADLINDSEFERIILHHNIGTNKKEVLLNLLDESKWDKIYSLREKGSLEFEF